MIPATTHQLILDNLAEIEKTENIRIAYACESGSRAWGFPSLDSDFDVRYIYFRPIDWYLSIEDRRDVLEMPVHDALDINGWDIRKALKLARKSNPPLLEWLGSPIVYLDRYAVSERMRRLVSDYYSPSLCLHHYLHMAEGNFREYLQGETVWVKKYFYVLRPLLAMIWIEKGYGIAPTSFNVLVESLDLEPKLRDAIYSLRDAKLAGDELDRGPKIPLISSFIEAEIARWAHADIPGDSPGMTVQKLDEFFRSTLDEVWKS